MRGEVPAAMRHSGIFATHSSMKILISRRVSRAPTQVCGPLPKVMCLRKLAERAGG